MVFLPTDFGPVVGPSHLSARPAALATTALASSTRSSARAAAIAPVSMVALTAASIRLRIMWLLPSLRSASCVRFLDFGFRGAAAALSVAGNADGDEQGHAVEHRLDPE